MAAISSTGQRPPLSEELGARLFCPPIHPCMSHEDNQYIAAAILEAAETVARGRRRPDPQEQTPLGP